MTSIGGEAFYKCSGLKSVTMGSGVTSIGSGAFYGTAYYNDASKWDASGVLYIGHHLIGAKNTISGEYNIKPDTKTIADNVFYGCSGLTSIEIPDSVTSIGEEAFYRCIGLESVVWNAENCTTAGDNLHPIFEGCTNLKTVTFGANVKTIPAYAFYGCSGLEKVVISNLAAWCSIEFSASSSNPLVYAYHLYLGKEEIKDLVIPDEITEIKNYAFYDCRGLESVTIKSSVTSIGSGAFEYCSGLKSIEIPGSVTSIGSSAFARCSGLTSVTIGSGVSSIGSGAFYGCSGLTSIKIPGSVITIGSDAFSGCSGLESVTIGNGVTSIGEYAFYDCSGLTSIEIPDSVTLIGGSAFYGTAYYNDESKWDASGVLYIGNYLIKAKNTIWGYYMIRQGTKTIADDAFEDCSELRSVLIPDSVISIGWGAFHGCNGLISVTIGSGVTKIGYRAFYECITLTDINFKGTVKEWQAIKKGDDWNYGTSVYAVTCTDGTVAKDGTVTYFNH